MRNARLAVLSAAIGFVAALAAGPSMSAVTLLKGQSALFNFDFTAVVPAPTYELLYFVWQWRDNTNDKAHTDYFGALYAGSNVLLSDDNGPDVFAVAVAWTDPYFLDLRDGVFSVRITSTSGTFSVNPYAYGEKGWQYPTPDVFGVCVSGSCPPPGGEAAVPVPATLTLFGLGLAGLGAVRRKKPAA